ncbi:MAG: tetratricopeptide repeat protein [Bacteroidales bacterium]|nr:tetratricopeptide repeat protein [Bacteroidales bacterium]
MKKIFLVLALIATVQIANAQKPEALKKAVAAAEAAAENPKKAAKAATWLKLGEAYMKAYEAPIGNIWAGASQQDLNLILGGQKPVAQEDVTINGTPYLKLVFEDKNIYLGGEEGRVAFYEVTNPVVDNALEKALNAYKKAYELEPKKAKEISEVITKISQKYSDEAAANYNKGDYGLASDFFVKAADAAASQPLAVIDTNAVYNAALCAITVPDYEKANALYGRCYEMGYYSDNGDVFARLSDINMHLGDSLKAKNYLEEGFQKFPQSQAILIGLINYYIGSGDGTDKLFELIDQAKKNEPNNASLYYVEGNIYSQLGEVEKADQAYEKCAEINPEYEFGYIGKGIMYYNLAVDAQNKANDEYDDAKYNELAKQFEAYLKGCIEPFEKAFSITKDESLKPSIAEFLKNAYFRFRDESPENQAAYEKYDKIARGE